MSAAAILASPIPVAVASSGDTGMAATEAAGDTARTFSDLVAAVTADLPLETVGKVSEATDPAPSAAPPSMDAQDTTAAVSSENRSFGSTPGSARPLSTGFAFALQVGPSGVLPVVLAQAANDTVPTPTTPDMTAKATVSEVDESDPAPNGRATPDPSDAGSDLSTIEAETTLYPMAAQPAPVQSPLPLPAPGPLQVRDVSGSATAPAATQDLSPAPGETADLRTELSGATDRDGSQRTATAPIKEAVTATPDAKPAAAARSAQVVDTEQPATEKAIVAAAASLAPSAVLPAARAALTLATSRATPSPSTTSAPSDGPDDGAVESQEANGTIRPRAEGSGSSPPPLVPQSTSQSPVTAQPAAPPQDLASAETARAAQAAPLDPKPVSVPVPVPVAEALPETTPASPTLLTPPPQPAPSALPATAVTTSLSHLSQATLETTVQIAAQISRRLEGRSTRFEMALTPDGLGRVDVSLDIDTGGQLTARLAFDNPLAATELRGRADELRRELQDAGFTIARDGFEFSERQSSSGSGFDRRQGRAFAGAAQVAADADLSQPAPAAWVSLSLTPRGVDLKV